MFNFSLYIFIISPLLTFSADDWKSKWCQNCLYYAAISLWKYFTATKDANKWCISFILLQQLIFHFSSFQTDPCVISSRCRKSGRFSCCFLWKTQTMDTVICSISWGCSIFTFFVLLYVPLFRVHPLGMMYKDLLLTNYLQVKMLHQDW